MLKVQKNKIYLTRGDSAFLTISLNDENGSLYELSEGDKIYFRLKKSSSSDNLLLEKEVNTQTLTLELFTLELLPEDTEDLSSGLYCYEVELVTAENKHYTVIENSQFQIGAELEIHSG